MKLVLMRRARLVANVDARTGVVKASMRFAKLLCLALVLLLGSNGVVCKTLDPKPVPALPAPALGPPPTYPSDIRLPVSVAIPPILVIDTAVCNYYSDHVTVMPDIFSSVDADYAVWRGPINLRLSGNTVSIDTHLYYWIYGTFSSIILPVATGSCGAQRPTPAYGQESTREMIVGLDSRLSWSPEWHLVTNTSVRNIITPNLCRVTKKNIDVTPFFTSLGERVLRTGAQKFDERVRELTDIRPRAREFWKDIQLPIKLTENSWLQINPLSVSAGHIDISSASPQQLNTTFGFTARPKVTIGSMPTSDELTLPPLQPLSAGPDGFRLSTDITTSFDDLNAFLNDSNSGLVGMTFVSGRRQLKITSLRTYGSNGKLALEIGVAGRAVKGKMPKVVDVVTGVERGAKEVRYLAEKIFYRLKGKIYLTGTPTYLQDQRTVIFPDLEYDLETRNVIAKVASWILKTRITDYLRSHVKFSIGNKIDQIRNDLTNALNRPIGQAAKLQGTVEKLELSGLYVRDNGILARTDLGGTARLDVIWP
jgi:hypothetical protein